MVLRRNLVLKTKTTMNTNLLPTSEFSEFPKMGRLSREMIITEKIDGTNAQICITEDGQMLVGSRSRWITTQNDNFGFARWCADHKSELLKLGPGRHFGEWWGYGIQRGYGMKEKRLSLFNVSRWCLYGAQPKDKQEVLPACVGLVPVLFSGVFDTKVADDILAKLASGGSVAAPGFMNPEGIIVYHTAANVGFKKTIKDDSIPKSMLPK